MTHAPDPAKSETAMLAYYEVTTKCNAHCPHCTIPDKQKYDSPIERSFSEIFSDFSYLKNRLDVTKIVLSGGEPTLRYSLPEMVHYARTVFRDVAVISNGSNFDVLQNVPCKKWVSIDYYGYKQDSYRGIKMWDNYLKLIKNVNVRATMFNDNFTDLKQLIETTRLNNTEITIVPYKGTNKDFAPSPEKIMILTEHIINGNYTNAVIDDSATRAYIASYTTKKDFIGCSACESIIRVKPNGKITPCPFLPTEICDLYDPNIQQKIMQYRNQLLTVYPEKCVNCNMKIICGGCKASANHHCPITT